MAVNLTQGWSAASLVPGITQAPAPTSADALGNSSILNSILSSILGSSGGAQPRQSTQAENIAASGYAGNLATKGMVAAAPLSLYAQLFGKGIGDPSGLIGNVSRDPNILNTLAFSGLIGGVTPNQSTSVWGPAGLTGQEQTISQQYQLASGLLGGTNNALSAAATAAAGAPTYAPAVQQSISPTGYQYNPFQGSSGWVSNFGTSMNPRGGTLGGYAQPASFGSANLANQLMSAGV